MKRLILILAGAAVAAGAPAALAQRDAAAPPTYGPVLHGQPTRQDTPDLRPLTEQEKRSGKPEPRTGVPAPSRVGQTPMRVPPVGPPPGQAAPAPAPPPPPRPVGPSTSPVNCSAGVCIDAAGNSSPQSSGNATVNSEGRLCTRTAAGTIQCN